jgi:hypothetical protein
MDGAQVRAMPGSELCLRAVRFSWEIEPPFDQPQASPEYDNFARMGALGVVEFSLVEGVPSHRACLQDRLRIEIQTRVCFIKVFEIQTE